MVGYGAGTWVLERMIVFSDAVISEISWILNPKHDQATPEGLKTNGSTLPHVRNKFYELYEVGMDSNGPAYQPKVRKNVNDTLVI